MPRRNGASRFDERVLRGPLRYRKKYGNLQARVRNAERRACRLGVLRESDPDGAEVAT